MKIIAIILTIWGLGLAKPQDLSLAKQYYKDAVYRSAADYFQKYLAEETEPAKANEARFGLAQSWRQMGDLEAALRSYEEFLNHNPEGESLEKALFASADVMAKLNKNHRAAERYYQLAQKGKGAKYQNAHYLSVDRSYAAGDMESVKERASTFIKKYVKGDLLPSVYLFLAKALRIEGNTDFAITNLEASLQLKEDQTARMELAEILEETGAGKAAIGSYEKALYGSDSLIQKKAYVQIVDLFDEYEEFDELVTFWAKPIQRLAGPKQRLKVAKAMIALKNPSEGMELLKHLEIVDSIDVNEQKLLMGKALLGLGERFEGIHLLKELGEKGEIQAWNEIAKAYKEDEMYLMAIQSIYRALEFETKENKPLRLLEIADIYENKLVRLSTARGVYEQFEMDFPNHFKTPQAVIGVARCYQKEEQWQAAARYYERILEDFPMSEYLAEAQKQWNHLTTHKIKHIDLALEKLLALEDSLNPVQLRLKKAEIQFYLLKEYQSAYEILQSIVADSIELELREEADFLKAKVLMAQADKKKDQGEINSAKLFAEQAEKIYEKFIQDTLVSKWDDDAQWELLEMKPYFSEGYDSFINKYPQSELLVDVHLKMAKVFLKEAKDLGLPHAEKAQAHFLSIMNLPTTEFKKQQALLGAAEANLLLGNPDQALVQLNIFEQLIGAELNPEALYLKAQALLSKQDSKGAIQAFKTLHYRFRNTPLAGESLIQMAKAQQSIGLGQIAQSSYRLFINSYPTHPAIIEAYIGVASISEQEGEWSKGRETVREFVSKYETHPEIYRAYGKMGFLSQLLDDRLVAAEDYKKAVAAAPENKKSDFLLPAAESFLRLQNYQEALPYYKRAYEQAVKPKEKALALSGELACLVSLGKTEAYLKGYKIFRKDYDDDINAHARIIYYDARKKLDAGDVNKAEKRFDYLADRFEESAWANEGAYYLGLMSFKKGRYSEAITKLQSYLDKSQLGQSAVDAKFKLAGAYFQENMFDKSAALYFEISEGEQGAQLIKYRARYNAALSYEKLNLWYKAALMYAKIFERDESFLTNNNLKVSAGFAWFRSGEFAKALHFFQEVLEEKSSERRAEAHFWYAKTLDHLNRVDESIEEFLKVNYLYRGEGMWGLTALFEVGQIYERSADYQRAESMYTQIVEQDGKEGTLGSRALVYLQKMHERMGLKEHGNTPR